MTSFELRPSMDDAFGQTTTQMADDWRVAPLIDKLRRLVPVAYVIAALAAALVAVVMSNQSGAIVWIAAVGAGLFLSLQLSLLPVYERRRSVRPASRLVTVAGCALLVLSAFDVVAPHEVRGALFVVAAAALVLGGAAAIDRLHPPHVSVLLVGGRVGVGQLVQQWSQSDSIDLKGVFLAGCVDEAMQEMTGVPILGSIDDVADVATEFGVDQVVVATGPLVSSYDIRRLSWALEGSSIELVIESHVHGVVPRRIRPRLLGHRLLLSVAPAKPSPASLLLKGVLDHGVALVLIVVLAPLFVVLIVLIRLDSHGPAFFRQERIGRDDKPFTMVKFRTMVVDAEARLAELSTCNQGAGPLFKMADDPRLTRVGALLRRSSLDELPQLFNVVGGHMSLVGPRPCLPREAQEYDDWERRRLIAKPGMTGAWQVGGRSRLTWQDSVRLDVDYADNSSLAQDLLILAKTVRTVARRDGAM